jgi:hypothetical protein
VQQELERTGELSPIKKTQEAYEQEVALKPNQQGDLVSILK